MLIEMMTLIFILLITMLLAIIAWLSILQQYRSKKAAMTKQLLTRHKRIADETEVLLLNTSQLPYSKRLFSLLTKRYEAAQKEIQSLSSGSEQTEKYPNFTAEHCPSHDNPVQALEQFELPDSEQQQLALIQQIKKLRQILREFQEKAQINASTLLQEDQYLQALQQKIHVDNLIKRGVDAYNANMLGSARQYFEKAQGLLNTNSINATYLKQKQHKILSYLEKISHHLKTSNSAAIQQQSNTEQNDERDALFGPKRKW